MMKFDEITTIEGFKAFIGKGNVFTAEFFKKDGSYRKMNAMLGVSGNAKKGKVYVKGTAPEATAKRAETNASKLQLGCYEMRGTIPAADREERIEAKNYRTLTVDPDRFIALSANGIRLVNPKFEALVIDGFDLGKDQPLPILATVENNA